MKRNLNALSDRTYDILVIGGGMYGACVAWEASLRGLSVALVEKADFASATSANSLKIIHGGLRYLQHADFKRMRESIRERTNLLRIAPHLIHPLPVLIPTYGHGLKGSESMRVALAVNDVVSCDRNWLPDPQKHLPNGRVLSRQKCLEQLPGIPEANLTGGALFCDAQAYNSERLVISFLRSAVEKGAEVANYVEATELLREGDRVVGVKVRDALSGDNFDIRATLTVNTSGPWVNRFLHGAKNAQPVRLAKAMNIITRAIFPDYAVGLSSPKPERDPDAVISKGSRFLFFAPWRGKCAIGTWYSVWDGNPDEFAITEADVLDFLEDINRAYPSAHLTLDDVDFVHGGLLPRTGVSATGEPVLAKHYHICDRTNGGIPGLMSVVSVKYTTARDIAEKVIDRAFHLWGYQPPKSTSATTPIFGGHIERFDDFLHQAMTRSAQTPAQLSEATIRRLVYNYGSAYPEVLGCLAADNGNALDDATALKAEVLYGVREEMAQTLSDILFRRTELGSAGYPGTATLDLCAETMGAELGWNPSKVQQEIQAATNHSRNRVFVRGSAGKQPTFALK